MGLHDISLFKIKNERLSRREWLVPNAQSRNLMGVGRELTQGTGITKDLVPQDEAVLQEEALAWIAKGQRMEPFSTSRELVRQEDLGQPRMGA